MDGRCVKEVQRHLLCLQPASPPVDSPTHGKSVTEGFRAVEVPVRLVSRNSVQLSQQLPPHNLRASRRADETANLQPVPSLVSLAQKPSWGETQAASKLRVQSGLPKCLPKHSSSSCKEHNNIHNKSKAYNTINVSINHCNFWSTRQIIYSFFTSIT